MGTPHRFENNFANGDKEQKYASRDDGRALRGAATVFVGLATGGREEYGNGADRIDHGGQQYEVAEYGLSVGHWEYVPGLTGKIRYVATTAYRI